MAISNKTKKWMERWLNMGKFPGSELGERDTGFRHRNYYHKHFMGYTEVRHVNEKGRIVIERCYTAPWQHHNISNARWVLTKLAYVLGALVTTALYLWALVQPVLTNSAAIVAAPGFLSGLLLVLLWMSVFTYVSAPRKMTLWEWRSGKGKIERFTRLTAAAILLTVIAKIVFICVWLDFQWEGEILPIIVLAVAALPLIAIYFVEHKMEYDEIRNELNVTDEERYDIQ